MPLMLALSLGLASQARAATPESTPVTTLDNALITTMKDGSAGKTFQARCDALSPIVAQTFNLPVITQNSVGFLWSTLPAAQQKQLIQLFAQFTVASYVAEFDSNSGITFQLLPDEKTLGDKKIVETNLVPGDGSSPTEIDYVVANGPAGWQITDVLLNGTISQVAIHASDFSSSVNMGDASQLITALQAKITALASSD